jgi:hypothetical protein
LWLFCFPSWRWNWKPFWHNFVHQDRIAGGAEKLQKCWEWCICVEGDYF